MSCTRYILSKHVSYRVVSTWSCACRSSSFLPRTHHPTKIHPTSLNTDKRIYIILAYSCSPESESELELEVSLDLNEGEMNKIGQSTHVASAVAFSSFHSSKIFCSVGPLNSASSSKVMVPLTAFFKALAALVWDLSFKKAWIKV